jgi:hypothetical protein
MQFGASPIMWPTYVPFESRPANANSPARSLANICGSMLDLTDFAVAVGIAR